MKFYKIFVSSSDVVTGNWQNGNYYVDVNVDELDPRYNWQMCVENFSISDSFPNGFMLTCPNLPIIDGVFSTKTKTTQNILFATNGNAYQKVVDFNTIGAKVMSPTNFRSVMLNFVLTDFTGTPLATAPAPTWGMVLVLYSSKREI